MYTKKRVETGKRLLRSQLHREAMSNRLRERSSTPKLRSLCRSILFLCIVWSNYVFVEPFFVPETSFALWGVNKEPVTTTVPSIITRRITTSFRRSLPNLQQSTQSQSSSTSESSSFPPEPSRQQSLASAARLEIAQSFRSILARNRNRHHRQRFVTGQFPVIVSVEENPTRRWLDLGRIQQQGELSNSVVLVNGTNIDRSLASYDRYQWLEEIERQELHDRYATVSMELLAEITVEKPGYLQIMRSNGAGSLAEHSRNLQKEMNDGGITLPWRKTGKYSATLGTEAYFNADPGTRKPLRDRLWSTGFSLTSPSGFIKSVDIQDGHIDSASARSESMISWPNEITKVPMNLVKHQTPGRNYLSDQENRDKMTGEKEGSSFVNTFIQDALLVADGFLIPGKDRGGIYLVNKPSDKELEWSVALTDPLSTERWFYHKAIWVDLTGDGRQSILTARAKLRKVASTTTTKMSGSSNIYIDAMQDTEFEQNRPKNGQLVWLEMPEPHHFDVKTGTPLEEDGTAFNPFDARHLPWKEHVLVTGPDVTFAVADMNPNDDTIEILASQFFDEKVTLHSIRRGVTPEVVFTRVIDDKPGAAFGGILADLDPLSAEEMERNPAGAHRPLVVDSGSTIKALNEGSSFSHFLVTSHEFNTKNKIDNNNIGTNMMLNDSNGSAGGKKKSVEKARGGSLLAYKVPRGSNDAWKTDPWVRTTIASGFQVKQQIWNVINPGAPGFVYAFHAHKDDQSQGKRPMIAVAGDCAESAYIFRPQQSQEVEGNLAERLEDPQADYKLMCEIKCGATVGSIAVGYDDLCTAEQESGYAKIYVPCFEKDKIFVFALGSGEEDDPIEFDDGGW